MARESIKYELRKAIAKATIQKSPVLVKGLKVKLKDEMQYVNLTVKHLYNEEFETELLIVVFEDIPNTLNIMSPDVTFSLDNEEVSAVEELEEQLMHANEYLMLTIEEMETSQEELKSMNEELILTNEELLSTNEELRTSREELQSLNEELLTINSDMQTKNEELEQANNDMRSLLYSIKIATLFLDSSLNIKRFTPEITKIINLIPTDIGRPLSDMVPKIKYLNLIEDVEEVLNTFIVKEVLLETMDGNWFNMRILPYRTIKNAIDGVVITFNNIILRSNI
jgi:two-component system CheB/CheR fusion protein